MSVCFAFFVSGLTVALASTTDIGQESRVGSTLNLVLVGKLGVEQVIEKGLANLGPPDITFGRLVVYASQETSRVVFRQNQTSCIPQSLVTFLEKNGMATHPLRCPEVSEVIKIGSNILLRTVDPRCQTVMKLLRGTSNPLVIQSMNELHNVVAVSVGVAPRSEETWGAPYPSIWVFVRTQAKLTLSLSKDIVAQMKNVSGARDVVVVVRNDADFGRHCQFPSPFLFGGPESVMAQGRSTYQAASDVICTSLYPHPVKCSTLSETPKVH